MSHTSSGIAPSSFLGHLARKAAKTGADLCTVSSSWWCSEEKMFRVPCATRRIAADAWSSPLIWIIPQAGEHRATSAKKERYSSGARDLLVCLLSLFSRADRELKPSSSKLWQSCRNSVVVSCLGRVLRLRSRVNPEYFNSSSRPFVDHTNTRSPWLLPLIICSGTLLVPSTSSEIGSRSFRKPSIVPSHMTTSGWGPHTGQMNDSSGEMSSKQEKEFHALQRKWIVGALDALKLE